MDIRTKFDHAADAAGYDKIAADLLLQLSSVIKDRYDGLLEDGSFFRNAALCCWSQATVEAATIHEEAMSAGAAAATALDMEFKATVADTIENTILKTAKFANREAAQWKEHAQQYREAETIHCATACAWLKKFRMILATAYEMVRLDTSPT